MPLAVERSERGPVKPLSIVGQIVLDKRRYPALWMVLGKTQRAGNVCGDPMREFVAWQRQQLPVTAAWVGHANARQAWPGRCPNRLMDA